MRVIFEKIGNLKLSEGVGRLFDRVIELGEGLPRMVGGVMIGESPRVVEIVENLSDDYFIRKMIVGTESLLLGVGLFLWLIAAYCDSYLGKERVVQPSGVVAGEYFHRVTIRVFYYGTSMLVVGLLLWFLELIVYKAG